MPPLPPLSEREPPWPTAWRSRVEAIAEVYGNELRDPELDPARRGRFRVGVGYLTSAAHRRDWNAIDHALEWLTGNSPPSTPKRTITSGPLATLRAKTDEELLYWLTSRTNQEVLEAVIADMAARFDVEEAGKSEVVIGVRLTDKNNPAAGRLIIAGGECTIGEGAVGHERVTLIADPLTLVRWALDRLDPWEAFLRGGLEIRGDGDLVLRLPAFFPPYPLIVIPGRA